jgi:FkbM family methyltransferase
MEAFRLLHKAFFRAKGSYSARLGGKAVRVDPDHMEFWRATTSNSWEPHTFHVLAKYLTRETTYYDIGAWIGPTAIYAADRCKKVVCFEPDPVAYRYLLWNLGLNALSNVLPLNIALADRDSARYMSSPGEIGDSMTSLLKSEPSAGSAEVMALRWDTWLDLGIAEKPDVMKIDIEGSEFALLPTLKDYLRAHKPTVYLSTHTPFLPAHERVEAMAGVVEVMALYRTCLNDALEPMDPQSLLSDEALARFHSVVLED